MTAVSRGGERLPGVGSYVLDVRDGRVGQVMEVEQGQVRLRPPGGGLEWGCPTDELGTPGPAELLRARVREVNRRRRLR